MATATRKCRHCKERKRRDEMIITPSNAAFCDDRCAASYGRRQIAKETKKKTREKKRAFYEEHIPTRREAAVKAFNKFIRLRDKDKPCISCGAAPGTFTLTAGHFRPAGSNAFLRFCEKNVHGQCWWNCNRNKSGNITNYRLGLLERFGEVEGNRILEYLEGPQPTVKRSAEDYKKIEREYKAKCRELENETQRLR